MHNTCALRPVVHTLRDVVSGAALSRVHACAVATSWVRMPGCDTHNPPCQSRHQGSCCDTQRAVPIQAWSRHQFQVVTPRRPDHVATTKLCRDTKLPEPCHDSKNCVATRVITLAHNEAFRLRHQKPWLDAPAAPSVATPKTVSRHQMAKPCRARHCARTHLRCRTPGPACRDLGSKMGSSPSHFITYIPLFFSFLLYPL